MSAAGSQKRYCRCGRGSNERMGKKAPDFKPIQILKHQIMVRGGHGRQYILADHRSVMVSKTDEKTFLKIGCREKWLVAAATGREVIDGGLLGRTTLISTLKDALVAACNGTRPRGINVRVSGQAGVDKSVVTDDTPDPMDQVPSGGESDLEPVDTDDDTIPGTKGKGKDRNRYFHNHCKGKVLEIDMREKAPEACPRDKTKRTIRLFCENRMTIWLCIDDAEWAVKYLRDQLDAKGVTHVPDDDTGPGGRLCDSEPTLAIEDGSLATTA